MDDNITATAPTPITIVAPIVPTKTLCLADLKKYDKDYVQGDAWKLYTPEELAWWVRLKTKQASLRVHGAKKDNDIADARTYLLMFREVVQDEALNFNRLMADALEQELNRIVG